MNLKEAAGHYYEHSKSLSAVTRQFVLGGLGLLWLIRSGNPTIGLGLSRIEVAACLALGLSLLLDLFQYFYLTAAWQFFIYRKRDEVEDDMNREFDGAWSHINTLGDLCFYGKAVACLIGLFLLCAVLGARLALWGA